MEFKKNKKEYSDKRFDFPRIQRIIDINVLTFRKLACRLE